MMRTIVTAGAIILIGILSGGGCCGFPVQQVRRGNPQTPADAVNPMITKSKSAPEAGTKSAKVRPRPKMVAVYAPADIRIDGKLDESVWANAKVYPLVIGGRGKRSGRKLHESGNVRMAWNEKYFYVAVDFRDSDVVAEGDRDNIRQYEFGDVCRVLLWPDGKSWCWELQAAPQGRQSSFFTPSPGRFRLPSTMNYQCGLTIAVGIDGTLNNWRDTDGGWSAEMAMPVKALTAEGDRFEPGASWRILIARGNYSYCLKGNERSTAPPLPSGGYYRPTHYASLVLDK